MQSGVEAVDLLVSRDLHDAYEKGKDIDQYNRDRKELDKQITQEANRLIENNVGIVQGKRSIVIYNKDWHKGIIGIVASRLTELYYKPAVVLTYSCLQILSLHLYQAAETAGWAGYWMTHTLQTSG